MGERNAKLEAARHSRGWTLEIASQKIGVHPQTLRSWETGKSKPHGFRIYKITQVYARSPAALGLKWDYHLPAFTTTSGQHAGDPPTICSAPVHAAEPEFLLLRLDEPVYTIEHLDRRLMSLIIDRKMDYRSHDYHALQAQMDRCIREYDEYMRASSVSASENLERLRTLRVIASLPIALYLEGDGASRTSMPEDILVHCAAGMTACWHMGQDSSAARTCVAGYLLLLSDVFARVEYYRSEAAELIAQASLLRVLIASHLDDFQDSLNYYRQALAFGRGIEPVDAACSHPVAPHRYGRQPEQALERLTEAIWLLKPVPMPPDFPLICGYVQKLAALYQPLSPAEQNAGPLCRPLPAEQFDLLDGEQFPSLNDYAGVALHLWTGVTHCELDEYACLLENLRSVDSLDAVADAPAFIRLAFLSNRALAALPLHDMHRAITILRALIPSALSLGDEKALLETREAYHLIQFLLPSHPASPTRALKDVLKKHD